MLIPVEYYCTFYLTFVTLFTLFFSITIYNRDCNLIFHNSNSIFPLLFILLFTLIVGYRPYWVMFGDSVNYIHSYNQYFYNSVKPEVNTKDYFFEYMMYYCSRVMDFRGFFLIVECFYIFPVLWACYKWVPRHYLYMFIFLMGAFSFYSYSYNGIRNGMACSLIIAALACVHGSLIQKITGGLLCFVAFNLHRSTALPIVCIIGSFFVKDTRYIMGFWLFSIVISLIAGGPVESFFASLGFDDRMTSYGSTNIDVAEFSSTGFRWDFLLYSAMPIVLGYYVVFIRKIWDKNYLLLLNTYILCNSFWVMMIRAAYSNRFAYLSWFMYALVLAYPCLKLPIWKDQGAKTAMIFMAHLGFTLFMFWLK